MAFAKRISVIVLGILLLTVAICWGYWTYRQYRASQTPVPRDATSLVRIHVDGLIRDIAWNALWNGAAYRDTTEKSAPASSIIQWLPPGVPIPASIFLYQVDHPLRNKFPTVYFGSLAVDDSTGVAAWLHDSFGMEIDNGEHGTVASAEHALVVIQPGRALFALSPTKLKADRSSLVDILATVLQQHGGSVAVSESRFGDMIHDDGQLSGHGANPFTVRFKKGLVAFTGQLALRHPPRQLEATPCFSDDNAVSLWVQDSLAGFLSDKQFNIGNYMLQGDSLLHHYGGRLAMEWKGTVMQQDTVVNYDYDDNFELVETQEIVEKPVPEIYWSIRTDTALISYLQTEGILEPSGNTVPRDAFPLFGLSVSQLSAGYVQFHTAGNALALPAHSGRSRVSLYLRVDFNRLHVPDLPTDLVPFTQTADRLELYGRHTPTNSATVHGTLQLKDSRLHSLVQLFKPYR